MFGKIKKNTGRYHYLDKKKQVRLYKRLLSVEFDNMPFYKYAIALASMLDDQFFSNILITGQARRETDITWFLKDYTMNLDFVAQDFSQFKKDLDLYKDVNLIQQDILEFKPDDRYDLIIVIDEITRIYKFLGRLVKKLHDLADQNARIIFFIRYFPPDQLIDDGIKLFTSTDEILKYLPFDVRSKIELKNYQKGKIQALDLIIDSFKH